MRGKQAPIAKMVGSPSLIPIHRYRAHPNPPAESRRRGDIKCRICGMIEDSPLHFVVVER